MCVCLHPRPFQAINLTICHHALPRVQLDLTFSQPSFWLNRPYDYLPDASVDPRYIHATRTHYYTHDDAQLREPYVSPLFARRHATRRLPPTLIQVGSVERLRDESLCFAHTHAGDVRVEVYADMVHVFQLFSGLVPFAKHALKRMGAWICEQLGEGGQVTGRRADTLYIPGLGAEPVVVERPMGMVEEAERIVVEYGLRPPAPL